MSALLGESLPSQNGNSGKFLSTNGTAAAWSALSGGGDMLAANNLSDVASAATSRTNLGVPGLTTANTLTGLNTFNSASTTGFIKVQRTGANAQAGQMYIGDTGSLIAGAYGAVNAYILRTDGTCQITRNLVWNTSGTPGWALEAGSTTGSLLEIGSESIGCYMSASAAAGTKNNVCTMSATWETVNFPLKVAIGNAYNAAAASSILMVNSFTTPHCSFQRAANSAYGALLTFNRSRGADSAKTILQNGDEIGAIYFKPYDGAAYQEACFITASVDGTPGTNDTPTRIAFWTAPDGSITAAERMRISNNGNVGIGGTANANAILDCQSTTKAFMPPRMTTAQRDAVASPTAGMVVYNSSTNKLNVYTTAWEAVTSA